MSEDINVIRYWLVSKWPADSDRPVYLRFNLRGDIEATTKPSLAMRYHNEHGAMDVAVNLGMPWYAIAVDFRRDAMVGS